MSTLAPRGAIGDGQILAATEQKIALDENGN